MMMMMETLRRVLHQYTQMLALTVAGPEVVGAGVILVVTVSLIWVILVEVGVGFEDVDVGVAGDVE